MNRLLHSVRDSSNRRPTTTHTPETVEVTTNIFYQAIEEDNHHGSPTPLLL